MEVIGIDLWTNTYVVLKNKKVICTENTVDYIEQQMKRKTQKEIKLTVASVVNDITISVKKTDIEDYYKKEEKNLVAMTEGTK